MTENERAHLDATSGAQLAMMVALKLLLTPYKGNQQAIDALQTELERVRASMLASSASDYKIHAFDEAVETLIATIA